MRAVKNDAVMHLENAPEDTQKGKSGVQPTRRMWPF